MSDKGSSAFAVVESEEREAWLGSLKQGFSPSVAVGGLGGSGTRLVANILQKLGIHIGGDLNPSNDNLTFTFLFKRPEILGCQEDIDRALSIFLASMNASPLLPEEKSWINKMSVLPVAEFSKRWSEQRAKNIYQMVSGLCQHSGYWGWKEPNTHLVIAPVLMRSPDLKYIHVMRNGLDMAFSRNQNQLKLWGECFYGERLDYTPQNSLQFWCDTHKRILVLKDNFPDRVLLLNFDNLCLFPEEEMLKVEKFLGLSLASELRDAVLKLIHPPSSQGRYKLHDLQSFSEKDIGFVREMGFAV